MDSACLFCLLLPSALSATSAWTTPWFTSCWFHGEPLLFVPTYQGNACLSELLDATCTKPSYTATANIAFQKNPCRTEVWSRALNRNVAWLPLVRANKGSFTAAPRVRFCSLQFWNVALVGDNPPALIVEPAEKAQKFIICRVNTFMGYYSINRRNDSKKILRNQKWVELKKI